MINVANMYHAMQWYMYVRTYTCIYYHTVHVCVVLPIVTRTGDQNMYQALYTVLCSYTCILSCTQYTHTYIYTNCIWSDMLYL